MRSTSRTTTRRLTVVFACAFMLGPLVANAVGVRSKAFENRPLTQFPAPSEGWSWFTDLGPWATDHLPGRNQAVDANNAVSERFFGDQSVGSASLPGGWPAVIGGDGGNLFYGGDIRSKCLAAVTPSVIADRVRRLGQTIESSGRRFVFVVAPDKSDLLSDELPHDYAGKQCAEARNAQMWPLLRAVPHMLDLRPGLRASVAFAPYPLYMLHDTHWDGMGGQVFVRSIVDAIEPGVSASFEPREAETVTQPGDLDIMRGVSKLSQRHVRDLASPRVTHLYGPIGPTEAGAQTFRSTGPDGTLVRERTLIVGDSFTSASQPMLAQVFADMTLIHVGTAGSAQDVLLQQIRSAQVIVVEVVERDLFAGTTPIVSESFLTELAKVLFPRSG